MYCGVPVACSDLEVLKEVAGDTVLYFKPTDHPDIGEKMRALYDKIQNGEIDVAVAKNRVESLYSLDTFVNKYEDLYKKIMEENK